MIKQSVMLYTTLYEQTEIACLEQTLMKRRAELKEADGRLKSCRDDTLKARNEAQDVLKDYESIKGQFDTVDKELRLLG